MTHTITFTNSLRIEHEDIEVDQKTYDRITNDKLVKFKGNIYERGIHPSIYTICSIDIDCTCYAKDASKGRIGCC